MIIKEWSGSVINQEKSKIISDTKRKVSDLGTLLIDNGEKINNSFITIGATIKNPLDVLISYSLKFTGLQKEIMLLQEKEMYTGFLSLTRTALECYSVFKSLSLLVEMNTTNSTDIENCLKKIAYDSICQEIVEYKVLDVTEQNNEMGKSYISGLLSEIKAVFSEALVKNENDEIDFSETIREIKRLKESLAFLNESISKRVKRALRNNPYINNELTTGEISYIYPNLCKFAHNNISSVLEDTTMDIGSKKAKCLSVEGKNDLLYMQINYYCLCDIYDELKAILCNL